MRRWMSGAWPLAGTRFFLIGTFFFIVFFFGASGVMPQGSTMGRLGWNSSCPRHRSGPARGACVESDRSALGLALVIRDETAAADAAGSRVRSVLRDLVQPDTQPAQVFGVGAGSARP